MNKKNNNNNMHLIYLLICLSISTVERREGDQRTFSIEFIASLSRQYGNVLLLFFYKCRYYRRQSHTINKKGKIF